MYRAQTRPEITRLLTEWSNGDETAFERLIPHVYEELRELARQQLRNERVGHTLEPTALVHEFYLRFSDHKQASGDWQHRAYFFGAAAGLMRRILIDYARKRHAQKRRAVDGFRLTGPIWKPEANDFEALDKALDQLAMRDARAAQIVELRYFIGLSVEDTAKVTSVSVATVKREWAFARTWLLKQLSTH